MPRSRLRAIAPGIPYLAVAAGLILFHSGWAALVGYHVGIIAVLTLEGAWEIAPRLLAGWHPARFALSLTASALSGPLLLWLWPWVQAQDALDAQLAAWGLSGAAWPAFALYFTLANGWLEEGYWRGYLGKTARGPCWADLWFAAYHMIVLSAIVDWPWQLFSLILLIAAAWLWRQAAHATGGLLVPVLAHIAADASIMLAVSSLRTRAG